MWRNQLPALLWVLCGLAVLTSAAPDSAGIAPLPGPGLSYGGIPYGSVSGNVAAYFQRRAPSVARARNLDGYSPAAVDFSPIEQWL